MKISKNLLTIAFIATTLFLTSCGNDDDAVTVPNVISVQDLTTAIDENPTVGQVVGTVVATQTVGGSTISYSIDSQTPTGALSINASTGELTVVDASLFDFENNPVLTATVSVDGAVNTAVVTVNINNINEIGDFNHGGVVFWIDPTDDTHGLVCTIDDQSTGIQWYNGSNGSTGANGTTIGSGETNTTVIINDQGVGVYAAQLCDDLSLNTYTDWFLPSIDELEEMYNKKAIIDATSMANSGAIIEETYYWSSTEVTTSSAKVFRFTATPWIDNGYKSTSTYNVRAVRAF